jgi:hypothetical protein
MTGQEISSGRVSDKNKDFSPYSVLNIHIRFFERLGRL